MSKRRIWLGIFVGMAMISIVLCLSLYISYVKQITENRPGAQPGTKWTSEDKTICVEIDEHGSGYGTLVTGDKVIDIYFATGFGRTLDIYRMIDGESYERIEGWTGYFKRKDMFTAVVSFETTYYEKGQKINFYRVDEW